MTTTDGAGASIIEIGTRPIFFEIRAETLPLPLQEEHSITLEEATLRFSYEDVPVLSYTLYPDEETLHIESEYSFVAIPFPQSKRRGNTLYTNNREVGVYIEGDLSVREQGMYIENFHALHRKPWEKIHEESGTLVTVEWSESDHIPHALLVRNEQEEFFLPFFDPIFTGYIPDSAQEWSLWTPGCAPNWTPIHQEPTLSSCVPKQIYVTSEGEQIWSNGDDIYLIPPNGTYIPSSEDIEISAGPSFEKEILSSTESNVSLERIFPKICIFSPLEQSIRPAESLIRLLGSGVQQTIISTTEFISPFSLHIPPFHNHIHAQRGFLMQEGESWLLSWPWKPIIREAGLGAIPTDVQLSKNSQLSYVDRKGRISLSNISFFRELREETQASQPDFIFMKDSDDRSALYELLDAQEPLRFLGPLNILSQSCNTPLPNSTLVRTLLTQEHSFGNGPLVLLSEEEQQWRIEAYAPSWMDVQTLALVGEGGNTHAQWSFDEQRHISVLYPKTQEAWTLAEIRGTHWAISPILFSEN
jgi:hypothetical protein